MQEAIVKMLHKIITDRVMKHITNDMCSIQKCLLQKEGILCARERIMMNLKKGCCAIQFDFDNAFGNIKRAKIIERLKYYNVPLPHIKYIAEVLSR